MPQLVPFFFVNEVTFTFITLVLLVHILSNYVLPSIVRIFTSRVFVSKL